MSEKETGGPAFPKINYIGDESVYGYEGMTLRDYFAAKAMQAYCTCPQWRLDTTPKQTAETAYLMADEMLEARK